MTPPTQWWVNGEPVDAPPSFPADTPWLRWGEGVFDTARVEQRRVLQGHAHARRLWQNAHDLLPAQAQALDMETLHGRMERAAARALPGTLRLRSTLALVAEAPPVWVHLMELAPWQPPAATALTLLRLAPPDLALCPAGAKRVAWQAQRHRLRQARASGADDALLGPADDRAPAPWETTTAALAWHAGDGWWVAPPWTVRSVTANTLVRAGLVRGERPVCFDTLVAARGLVTLSSLALVQPVQALVVPCPGGGPPARLAPPAWQSPPPGLEAMRACLLDPETR